jgi:hypothetical protein
MAFSSYSHCSYYSHWEVLAIKRHIIDFVIELKSGPLVCLGFEIH